MFFDDRKSLLVALRTLIEKKFKLFKNHGSLCTDRVKLRHF